METVQKIGRYEVIDELGRGAMGSVFRANDPAVGRVVAVKTILPAVLASEDGKEFRDRFQREARAAGALAHPGIVPVFDVGEHEGMPYLVMEYVNGQTLAQAMRQGGLATLERICEIGQQIADALAYAHRSGVVHRDIKPANILLTSPEVYGSERAKITDFGVAKLFTSDLTNTGKMVGTPTFMPPEQFTGAPIDGRTDIFSVGVILYWMTTGEQPFAGETMTSVSYKVVHTDPIPPSKLNPAVSPALEAVILKCMAKNPADRFQTGDELSRALVALRSNAAAAGHDPSTTVMGTGISDATIIGTPSVQARRAAAQASGSTAKSKIAAPVAPAKKKGSPVFLVAAGIVIVAALGGVGWFLTHREQPAQETQSQPAPAPVAQPAPQPAVTTPPPATDAAATDASSPDVSATDAKTGDAKAGGAAAAAASAQKSGGKPAAGTAKSQPTPKIAAKNAPAANAPAVATPAPSVTPPVVAPTTPPPSAPAVVPAKTPAAVEFNPKKLDPKTSVKLKLDMSKVPGALQFVLDMDGKVYYKGTAQNRGDFDTLYAPTGVHEFRLTVGTGANAKTSNTVSGDFSTKKRINLRVDLRPSVDASATALEGATQVVLTLKQDWLFF